MKKLFLIPILLFISFLLIIYFVLPRYSSFKDLRDELSEIQQEIDKIESSLVIFEEISSKLESHQEAVDKIKSALPDRHSFAYLLKFFQDKTSQTGLLLKSLSESIVSEEERKEDIPAKLKEYYYNLVVKGSFPGFENFLKAIEDSSRLIEVENISIKRSEDLLEFSLLIKVYSY